MVSTHKKKTQQKKQFSQLDETLNDFVLGYGANANVLESGNLEQQTDSHHNDLETVDDSTRQNQVIEGNIDDQITRTVSSAVMTVENRIPDAIMTAIDKVVIPRVEMAVKSITGPTGHELKSEVQNPDRRDFLGNIRNTPLMSASIWLDLDNELDRNDETRNNEDFEEGDFPALRPNYDRRAHAHRSMGWNNSVYLKVQQNSHAHSDVESTPEIASDYILTKTKIIETFHCGQALTLFGMIVWMSKLIQSLDQK